MTLLAVQVVSDKRLHQGSSVAESFNTQPGWKLRGVTRKPFSEAAVNWQYRGVEIVYGDMDRPESMQEALQGAAVVFGVTDFWQHLKDPEVHKRAAELECSANEIAFEREISQGKVRT